MQSDTPPDKSPVDLPDKLNNAAKVVESIQHAVLESMRDLSDAAAQAARAQKKISDQLEHMKFVSEQLGRMRVDITHLRSAIAAYQRDADHGPLHDRVAALEKELAQARAALATSEAERARLQEAEMNMIQDELRTLTASLQPRSPLPTTLITDRSSTSRGVLPSRDPKSPKTA